MFYGMFSKGIENVVLYIDISKLNVNKTIVIVNSISSLIVLFLNKSSKLQLTNVKECDILSQRFRYLIQYSVCYLFCNTLIKPFYINIKLNNYITGCVVIGTHFFYSILLKYKKHIYIFISVPIVILINCILIKYNFYKDIISYNSYIILKTIIIPIEKITLITYKLRSRILISIIINISLKSLIEFIAVYFNKLQNILFVVPIFFIWIVIMFKLEYKYQRDVLKNKTNQIEIDINPV